MTHNALLLLILSLIAMLVSACGSSPNAAGGSASGSGAPTAAAATTNVAVGQGCVSSDPNKICLAIHFVTYTDASGQPLASQDAAAGILQTMNKLWAQCNIGFEIEKFEAVDPTAQNLPNNDGSQTSLDQVRQAFQSPTNELLAVTTGNWSGATNAWTNMPGDGVYGAVMEASIVNYYNGVIYAHEFGHYLGLDHVSDTSNLMNPVLDNNTTQLDSGQCQTARDTANSYWAAMQRR